MSDVTLNLKVVGLNEIKAAADNMARLGTVVGEASGDFRLTGSQILRYVKAANTLERETRRLTKAEDQGIITTQRKKLALEELERKLQKQILLDKSVIKSSKEAAAREKKLADEIANTAAKYDSGSRVRSQYLTELQKLKAAKKAGAISAEVYKEAVGRLDTELRNFHSGLANGANQFAKYDMATYKSIQSKKRFASVGLQQAGYQVGDFIVQIQSGQSALVAFGQQGSQLAGIFGPKGAVIGAIIAGATALLMIAKAARDAKKSTDDLANSMKPAMKAMQDGLKNLALENFKASRGIEDNTLALGKQSLEYQNALVMVNDYMEANGQLNRYQKVLANGIEIFGFKLLKSDEDRQKILEERTKAYEKELEQNKKRLAQEEAAKKFLEDQVELRKKLRDAAKDLEEQFEANNRAAIVQIGISEEDLKLLQLKADVAKNNMDTMLYGAAQGPHLLGKTLDVMLSQEGVQWEINELAQKRLRTELSIQGVEKTIINQRVEQLKQEQDLTAELKEQLRIAKLQEEAFGTVYGMMEGSAGAKALRKYGGRGFTSDKDPTDGATGKSIYDKKKKTGKTELERLLENYDKYIAKLQTTSKVESELVQVFGMERRVQEQLIAAKEKYAALGEKVDHKELERTIRQIEADKQRHKFLQQAAKDRKAKALEEGKAMEDLFKSMESSFGDALMTIADGTKSVEDSFKTMAHAIIKELYQIFVVKQITGFVSQSAQNYMAGPQQGPTLSGAPLGGNYLKSADGGGYTGNGPRSGGLDGKGGFMAMLHPRETVVDHTKGRSSGLVVNQTINVSTGVQQTVRAEVMGLMPQIAAASKGAVLDAKRRGGAYAGAF